jgi:hypothetical protein
VVVGEVLVAVAVDVPVVDSEAAAAEAAAAVEAVVVVAAEVAVAASVVDGRKAGRSLERVSTLTPGGFAASPNRNIP